MIRYKKREAYPQGRCLCDRVSSPMSEMRCLYS
ncbi:hypothetical protein SAMN05660216_01435 [Pseudomonas sp. LAMO17WK12:I8]|uniref:Outer membrane protein assembly factor BamB n=1 Tax=Pseudomonas monteilii TaxID=76759 RepID=A0AAE6REI6_9PSED|nr:hypothetical protein [Pseudomonas sp. OG7]QHB28996.1 outer membrane protein assembly factor BamB [Pseudomonas monteilii]SMC49462.1 hypothetical protein SAMN05660385_01038 [Pseudomonas sp. URIL14HWK12:I5]SNB63095.1 hypothetical protein SAMN02745900_01065 [Pseudomonas sp. URIL14HWK12:I8]SNS72315.1 hypothetical protein SAMN05660216_01435 [Pseudomonas sp. LAMO17WK12:I8]SNY09591.1 hypothetical protein SAMN05660344_01014 [Pseudomonas sp. LAMO17WK12:I11]SNY15273.1 hypothetical protein SAMN0566089